MATIDPTPEQLLAHITGQPLRTGIHSDLNACMYRAGCQQTEADNAALRKDAERWRYWRNYWPALCRMEVARFAGLDLTRVYVQSPADMDAVTDAAMQRPPAVG